MYIEQEYHTDKETARVRIDAYIEKLNKLRFPGNFQITDLKKSWTNDEMQFSFNIKSSVLERRVKGVIQIDELKIILEAELPTITKNFIKDENLEAAVRQHIGIALSV